MEDEMIYLLGAAISVAGLFMHHPAITLIGIGLMGAWMIFTYVPGDEDA